MPLAVAVSLPLKELPVIFRPLEVKPDRPPTQQLVPSLTVMLHSLLQPLMAPEPPWIPPIRTFPGPDWVMLPVLMQSLVLFLRLPSLPGHPTIPPTAELEADEAMYRLILPVLVHLM